MIVPRVAVSVMTALRLVFFSVVAASMHFVSAAWSAEPNYPPSATLEEIHKLIIESTHSHPRLFATRDQLVAVSKFPADDPLRKELADAIVQEALSLRDAAPVERKLLGRRLLSVSRLCAHRVLTLAMAYHLTGEVQFVDRCRKEMLAAARFSDWNPSHFLDVGEMTFALAIGYDWLYDQLDDASRKEIRTAIVEKALKLPFETKYNAWVHARNNWGQVCHGGLTVGALAVMDEEPRLAARTVHNALSNVIISMEAYAPHGSYPEGPGYWTYGTTFNVFLIASLESALGTDFGLSHAPGFSETGAFPAMVCGPSGQYFNFADGHAGRSPEPILFWFATRFHRPDWLFGERRVWSHAFAQRPAALKSSGFMPLALLWMNEPREPSKVDMPLSWSVGGSVPISIQRSSWDDPQATFVGFKGGSPRASHAHMDIGSFVLDSDGRRWATDLGAEDYYKIESRKMDLWNTKQNADRWKIFRLSNLSHNTLVIDDQPQDVTGKGTFIKFRESASTPFSIIDMGSIYRGRAESVKRGIAVLPNGEVLIQDQLTGVHPGSRVRWQMVTTGIHDDLGHHTVILHQQNEKLTLMAVAPATATWSQIDTAKARHEWDSPNPNTSMMAIESRAPESGEMMIAVVATPGSCKTPSAAQARLLPLDSWEKKLSLEGK